MAEEEETREVLFPDWEGPDKTGLTIEQTSGGEIFVKEVKGESPAARSGKVYQGDQIVGATVYFDNMSSEETAELLKTLNRHKVGLKLQNKGDKSPYCSPLSTPCRSPMGTLTWEGKTRFGGSSPDIILSGDDDDYKRIYTKKIKPRLKSEDLAEGVDVRTERHSSTSSDGSTITTITRRITTYTVDMPGGISEQLELSSPEFKGLRHESGDGSPRIRISHGSPSGKVGTEEGVFESSNVSYTGPQVSSTETRWGSGGVQTTTIIREGERERVTGLKFKGPNFGVAGGKGQGGFEISRGSGEQGDVSIQVSETSTTLRDSTNTGNRHITVGGLGNAEVTSTDENGGSAGLSLPGKSMHILTSTTDKTQKGGIDTNLGERTKVKVSEAAISHPQAKGSDRIGMSNVRLDGGHIGTDTELRGGRIGGSAITVGSVTSGYSSGPGKISVAGVDVSLTGSKLKGEVDLPSTKGEIKASGIDTDLPGCETEGTVSSIKTSAIKVPVFGMKGIKKEGTSVEVKLSGDADMSVPVTYEEVQKPELDIKGTDIQIKGPSANIAGSVGNVHDIKGPTVNIEGKEGDLKMSQIKTLSFGSTGPKVDVKAPQFDIKAPKGDIRGSDVKTEGLKFKIGSKTGPTMPERDISLKGTKQGVDVSVPEIEGHTTKPAVEIKGSEVDIERHKGGFEMPKIKMPSFGFTGPKAEATDIKVTKPEIDVKAPEVHVKTSKVNVKSPDVVIDAPKVDIDIEGPEGGFNRPKSTMPSTGLKGPKLEGGVTVSVPKIKGDITAPGTDIKGPQIDITGTNGGVEIPKIKMPSFGTKGKGPDVDVHLPKGEINVTTSELEVKAPVIDVEGDELKGPKINISSIKGPTMADVDLKLGLPGVEGDVDISMPKIETHIKAPEVDRDVPDVDTEGHKSEFKIPKVKIPSFGIKGPKVEGPEVNVVCPKADMNVKAPEVEIKGLDVDIEGSGNIKGSKFKVPSLSRQKISMPDVDLRVKGPELKGDVDVSGPKIEGDTKTLDVDVKDPKVDIEGPKGGFEMPKIKMPSFGFKGPKVEGPDVDINFPKANIDVKAPDVDIKGPEIDIEGPDAKLKGPKIKMPSVSGPKLPDWDISLKGTKIKGDVDVSVPKIEGDIKGPKVDIEGPDLDIDSHKGGFKMPKFKMPSFGMKGPNIEGPDVDVSLPKADIDIKAPEMDIKGPDIDIDSPSGKIKGPKFNMPTISGPKLSMPDVDFKLKGSKLKGDVDLSAPKIGGDIKTPEFDIKGPQVDIEGPKGGFEMPKIKMPSFGIKGPNVEGPDVDINLPKANIDVKAPDFDIKGPDFDIESPSGKIKGPKFNMPNISGPKLSMPDVDFNLKGPKLKGDVDMSVPKIKGDIETPDIDIKGPQVDIKGPKGGIDMPKIKMPSFGFKGPKVEGPDVDINLPKANIDVKVPDVDIKGPEIDVACPDGKVKGPKIKLPTISGPTMPDWDISLKGPKVKGDVDVSVPKIEGDIKAPKVDIEGPGVDIDGRKGGLKMPKFKMPSFGVKGPNLEGPEVDVSMPKADIDIKAPDVDIKGPEVDIEGPDAKLKGPKFSMPTISGPKLSMPDVDFKLKGPKIKGDVDLSAPKIEGDIKTPDVDIKGPEVNIEGPKGGFEMPKITMPSFNMKGQKVEGPDVDINLPKTNIDVKAPGVHIISPEIDIEGPDAKIKGPKFNMPSISGPKISMPNVDFNVKSPKLKGDVDVSAPKIEGDIKTPGIDIKGPEVDIEGPKGGFEMPKIKMPSFGFKGPQLEGPGIDVSLPKSNINVKAPDLDANLKGSKVKGKMDASVPKVEADIKGPNANIAAPTITMEGVSIEPVNTGVTFPKFKGPKFEMKSTEVEGPESMVKTPKFSVGAEGSKKDVSLPDTEASLDVPDIDINVKGKKGKFKLPKVKGKAKKPDVDIETPAVNLDVDTPNIHVKGKKVKKPLFGKLNFPDVELDIKSPKTKGDGSLSEGMKSSDIDLPSASLNTAIEGSGTDSPKVRLQGPDVKLKTPNIKMSNVNISTPDIDANLNRQGEAGMSAGFKGKNINVKGGAEIDASVSGDSATGDLHYPEGTVTFPKMKVPKFGIALPQLEGQHGGGNVESELAASGDINIPSPSVSYQVSSQNIEVPSPELRHSEGKVKVKMPKFFGKSKAKGSSVGDLRGPEVELSTSGKGSKVSKDVSVHTGELMGGKFEGDPGLSVSTKGKSASLDLFKKSRHRSSSLSDEGGLAVSSPSGHLEAEGGDISLDLGESKVKGKKSKLKFGTFGGFGSKSKGSYEVTLGEESEAGVEGSAGVSLASKKSRLSSSSSNDSGSKGGFRFPRLELSVSPKKD